MNNFISAFWSSVSSEVRGSAPIFTPPQTQPLSSYPQNVRSAELLQDGAESSAESEFPTLSLTEIQNARGVMDVLAEMLNAIDPGNKEGLNQEVIVDLVEQCRTYKQRVVHLVNSTSDKSLLKQGLALNDDLQRVLAKHEAIASGSSILTRNPKSEPPGALVDVNSPLVDTGDNSKDKEGRSTSGTGTSSLNQLLLPAPPAANGAAPPKMDPKMDLLSGDDFSSPKAENSLSLVPVGGQQSSALPSDQNALVLFDMFSDIPNLTNPINTKVPTLGGQSNLSTPQFQQQQQNIQALQPGRYANEAVGISPAAPQIGSPSASTLPPPPWEAQVAESSQGIDSQYTHRMTPQMGNEQAMPMYMPQTTGNTAYAGMNNYLAIQQTNQMFALLPQQMHGAPYMGMVPQQMRGAQMPYMYPQPMYNGQPATYMYGKAGMQYIDQWMYGLSVRDGSGLGNPSSSSASSYKSPMKQPSRPDDKLFGDLVNMAKMKSPKPATPGAGSM